MPHLQWLLGLLLVGLIALLGVLNSGTGPALEPAVLSIAELPSHSQEAMDGLAIASIARMPTGEVRWFGFENFRAPLHYHGQGEFFYVLSGSATLTFADGSSRTLEPGQLVLAPAGVPLGVEASGEILLFTTPPGEDTVFLEGPDAEPGAEAPSNEAPQIIDVAQRLDQGLDLKLNGLSMSEVHRSETGSISLFRLEGLVPRHTVPYNEIVYQLGGRARATIGTQTFEVGPGEVIVLPAGIPHEVEPIGEGPVDAIGFSTPPPPPQSE